MTHQDARIMGRILIAFAVIFGPATAAGIAAWQESVGAEFVSRALASFIVFMIVFFLSSLVLKFVGVAMEILMEDEKR